MIYQFVQIVLIAKPKLIPHFRVKFVAPSPSDKGQYLISLVVPEATRKEKNNRPPAKQPLQIIPIRTADVKAKKAREVTKEAEKQSYTTILDGKEVLVPAEAMVEREAMAIFRDG